MYTSFNYYLNYTNILKLNIDRVPMELDVIIQYALVLFKCQKLTFYLALFLIPEKEIELFFLALYRCYSYFSSNIFFGVLQTVYSVLFSNENLYSLHTIFTLFALHTLFSLNLIPLIITIFPHSIVSHFF